MRPSMILPRRHLARLGLGGTASALLTGAAMAQAALPGPAPVDTGAAQGNKVTFPPWTAPTERPSGGPPNPWPVSERVGFAVVGLGRLALEEIIPAFGEAKRAKLVALVSGSPDKARAVAAQTGIGPEAVYDYAGFDRIRDNPAIQVVYIVLPNGLHHTYTLRAAAAGKHVLSEKPMATSVAECEGMIAACKAAGRLLIVAYRCQYEPYNREVRRLVREETLGPVRFIDAVNLQNMGEPTQWRFNKALAGGGALPDIGLYCLNAARFITGEEPVELFARAYSPPGDARYREVEETIQFSLTFPSGTVANCMASYGMHEHRTLSVHTPGGAIELADAFSYDRKQLRIGHRDGPAEQVDDRRLVMRNQFALELDHMATCVATGRTPHTPGEEGLQDQRLMEAIYRSAASGRPVTVPAVAGLDTTRGPPPEET